MHILYVLYISYVVYISFAYAFVVRLGVWMRQFSKFLRSRINKSSISSNYTTSI
jgi:hypothetical protein